MEFIKIIRKTLIVLSGLGFFLITACGGGGGGGNGSPPATADTTPDAFSFTAQSTLSLSTWVESGSIEISGINQATSVSIAGGEYQINGQSFSGADATVVSGDNIRVRVLSAANLAQSTSARLTVGDVSAEFNVTTVDQIFSRAANTTCIAPVQADSGNSNIQLSEAFPNLPNINSLVGLYQSPGDTTRWYAMSQNGNVYWFDNSPSANALNNYADLSAHVRFQGERGLLGMAFDPQYAANGRVYFSYVNNSNQSIIARLTHTASLPLDTSSPHVLLTLTQPASNHNGGNIAFGPDNQLYIGFGDGGGSGDSYNNGQNTQSLHSTIMRINVTGDTYTIPADNPFINDANVRDEIYAYGLRNPWRWSFDRQTGLLWVGDVGQGAYEEIDIVKAGDNLGWPIMEGNHCFGAATCNTAGLTLPVTEFDHNSGDCSVTGGFVYRGQKIPSLQGNYIYGDYCSGTIRTAVKQPNQTYDIQQLLSSGQNISSFAQGADGEVLVLALSGRIYQFTDTQAGTGNIPDRLSATGCFTSTQAKSYPDFVVPFNVESWLWTDGEDKSRFFAIPDGTSISMLPDGDFEFPDRTILVKNFMRNGTYLETRLFMKHVTGWVGYSYRWLDDQSDAILVPGNSAETVMVNNIEHIIPSRGQCFECHTQAASVTLGPEASQLDFNINYAGNVTGNQLHALTAAGYLTSLPEPAQLTEMASINDSSASLELRARSYLHSNCSGCHRPGAPGSQVDFRIQTSLSNTMACDQIPNNGSQGINNARIIAPGDPNRSILVTRIQTLDPNIRMPAVGSQVVHDDAVSVISQWISGLTACQ